MKEFVLCVETQQKVALQRPEILHNADAIEINRGLCLCVRECACHRFSFCLKLARNHFRLIDTHPAPSYLLFPPLGLPVSLSSSLPLWSSNQVERTLHLGNFADIAPPSVFF